MKRLLIAALMLFPFMVQATVLLQSRDGTIGAGYTSPEPGFGVKVSFDNKVTTLAAAYRYKDFKAWVGAEQYTQKFETIMYSKVCTGGVCSVVPLSKTTETKEYGADLGVGYYVDNIFVYTGYGTAIKEVSVGVGYGF